MPCEKVSFLPFTRLTKPLSYSFYYFLVKQVSEYFHFITRQQQHRKPIEHQTLLIHIIQKMGKQIKQANADKTWICCRGGELQSVIVINYSRTQHYIVIEIKVGTVVVQLLLVCLLNCDFHQQ